MHFSLLSSLFLNIIWIQPCSVSVHYCTGDHVKGGKLGSFLKLFYNTYLYLQVYCTSRTYKRYLKEWHLLYTLVN